MKYLFWPVLLIAVCCLTALAFDVVPMFRNMLGRRGIGSLSGDAWLSQAERRALVWLKKGIPEVPKIADRRLVIIDRLRGSYRAAEIGHWQQASVLAAVNETDPEAAAAYMQANLTSSALFEGGKTDTASLAFAMLRNPAADPAGIRQSMDGMAHALLEQYRAVGSVPYRGDTSVRFVDTVGLACPFLAQYALTYQCEEALQAAMAVITEYGEEGLHPKLGLPAHCFRKETGAPLGICGWGRGSGWWAVGLADTFAVMQTCEGYEKEKTIVLKYLLSFCETVLPYQSKNGAFDRNLLYASGADSSATAMLAFALAYAAKLTENAAYAGAAESALRYVFSVTRRDGTVDYSQGDTMGIGFYSQASIVLPAAQGFAIRAYRLVKEMRAVD